MAQRSAPQAQHLRLWPQAPRSQLGRCLLLRNKALRRRRAWRFRSVQNCRPRSQAKPRRRHCFRRVQVPRLRRPPQHASPPRLLQRLRPRRAHEPLLQPQARQRSAQHEVPPHRRLPARRCSQPQAAPRCFAAQTRCRLPLALRRQAAQLRWKRRRSAPQPSVCEAAHACAAALLVVWREAARSVQRLACDRSYSLPRQRTRSLDLHAWARQGEARRAAPSCCTGGFDGHNRTQEQPPRGAHTAAPRALQVRLYSHAQALHASARHRPRLALMRSFAAARRASGSSNAVVERPSAARPARPAMNVWTVVAARAALASQHHCGHLIMACAACVLYALGVPSGFTSGLPSNV